MKWNGVRTLLSSVWCMDVSLVDMMGLFFFFFFFSPPLSFLLPFILCVSLHLYICFKNSDKVFLNGPAC